MCVLQCDPGERPTAGGSPCCFEGNYFLLSSIDSHYTVVNVNLISICCLCFISCSDATDEHYGTARQLLSLISNNLACTRQEASKTAVLKSSASPSLISFQGDDVPLTEQTVTQVREGVLQRHLSRSQLLFLIAALQFTYDSFRK